MSIMKWVAEWACHMWFVLLGVNSAEMLLWNKTAYRARPKYEVVNGEVVMVGVKMIKLKYTQFIKIPKRHGMMSAFANGTVIPVILLDALDPVEIDGQPVYVKLDTEGKSQLVKFINQHFFNDWKREVMAGNKRPDSSPQIAWFHPTANRQPQSLVYLSTPEQIGAFTGMDPYAQVERLNKALGPASTPTGWVTTDFGKADGSTLKELRLLAVDEDKMEMIFGSNKLSVEDGPVVLKDYAVKMTPYVSDVGKAIGVMQSTQLWKNLAFQIRVRGLVTVNDAKKRIIAKCCCNGGTEIVESMFRVFEVSPELGKTLDGVLRCDNFKSKNIKPGDIVTITIRAFEIAKTANVNPENSSSLGVQAVVGRQDLMELLHKEHASAEMREMDGSKTKLYRAAIFRKAIWERDLAANLFILTGDKKEISMADFKSISTSLLCNGIKDPNNPTSKKPIVCFTESWLNTLIPRWLRFLRDKVWTIQGSKYSQYIAATRVMKKDGKKSMFNELDDLRTRYHEETGIWKYFVLPPKETIIEIATPTYVKAKGGEWVYMDEKIMCEKLISPQPKNADVAKEFNRARQVDEDEIILVEDGWSYVNRKKDPQTSSLNLQGCSFCYRDELGQLQFLTDNLQEVGVLQRMEFSGIPNGWATPTSDEFGEDKDGDLLSILLSRIVHFPSHRWVFPNIGGGTKDKVAFTKPETFEEWANYIEYINSQYDGYAIAAKNTGMLDLETRLQCCVALVRGWLTDGAPFTEAKQRMFNYIREELGIKVSKHGLGGKTGGALVDDPQELLRSISYGEIEPKDWPHLFRATHKYGGVSKSKRWDNRKVLETILSSVLKAERFRADGSKIDFFLNYAFVIIRRAKAINSKLALPKPDIEGCKALAKSYQDLWEEQKNKLSKGTIFTPNDVIRFIGADHLKEEFVYYKLNGNEQYNIAPDTTFFEGIRNRYSILSSSYQGHEDKAEKFKSLGLGFTYLLSYHPYHRGVLEMKTIIREFALSKYLRFTPIKNIIHKPEPELTDKERAILVDRGWLDSGVVKKETGEFIVFERGFKGEMLDALKEIEIERVSKELPKFYKIKDSVKRNEEVDKFLKLCIIYMGAVGFGAGIGREGKRFTKTATLLNYFKPELYVSVARMRYKMLGLNAELLDWLEDELLPMHDQYVQMEGVTPEEPEDEA